MNILCVDLGSVTGLAVVSDTGNILYHGRVTDADFRDVIGGVIRQYDPSHIVCEEPLIIHGALGKTLRTLAEEFKAIAPNAEYVRPSEWKPHPVAKTPLTKIRSPHERDAIHIGLWYVKTRLQGAS